MLLRRHVGLVASGESSQINEVGKNPIAWIYSRKLDWTVIKLPGRVFKKHTPPLSHSRKKCLPNIDSIMTLRVTCPVEKTFYSSNSSMLSLSSSTTPSPPLLVCNLDAIPHPITPLSLLRSVSFHPGQNQVKLKKKKKKSDLSHLKVLIRSAALF